ncbi:MAG: GDSL-type esterase/lipase family protein [Myxococcota bacterium]
MSQTTADDQPRGLMDEDGRPKSKVSLDGEPQAGGGVQWSTVGRVGPAMAVIAAALVAVFTVPGLEAYRPWQEGDPLPFWNVVQRPFASAENQAHQTHVAAVESVADEVLAARDPAPPVAAAPTPAVVPETGTKLPAFVPEAEDEADVVEPLELFKGDELDRFFESLARTDASLEGAVTRISHWGDSAIGIDGIPGAIRRRMQNRFGDAGHGFHLMAPPNTSYRHREVDFAHNDAWSKCFIIQKCRSDGHYGLGGTTFRSGGGAQSSFAPHSERSSGKVSKIDIYYAAQPKGGRLSLRVDGGEKTFLETEAPALEDRFHSIKLPDGPHELKIRAGGGGRVRIYGVTMERDGPGIVWDGLALVGAFTKRMSEFDPDHLKRQLAHRKTDLAVFMFGGNDMVRKIKMSTYAEEYTDVIQKFRTARPEMDCLIMSPLDHGERKGQRIISRPVVPKMVNAMRDVAKAEGCAFFDTFQAMGGEGSAGRWFRRKPRLTSGDLGHATSKGHQVIGELFFRALVSQYVTFRKARDAAGGIPAIANEAP